MCALTEQNQMHSDQLHSTNNAIKYKIDDGWGSKISCINNVVLKHEINNFSLLCIEGIYIVPIIWFGLELKLFSYKELNF